MIGREAGGGPAAADEARVVVVVSHVAPPEDNPGANRLGALVRHLPAHGWHPAVVAGGIAGCGSVGGWPTLRPGEPLGLFHRLAGTRPKVEGAGPRAAPGRAERLVVEHLAVPDLHVGWAPGATLAAARLARRLDAAAILSSSPPESAHLAAMGASRLTGLPWVAELRDGWMSEGLKPLAEHPVRRRVEAALERAMGRRATLVGVTRPIAADLQRRYGEAHWVPNGFDDEVIPPEAAERARRLLDPAALNLVYTGSFATSRFTQSPEPLAAAMRLLAGERPGGRPVALTVAGTLTESEHALLEATPGCRVVPRVPRPVALALQRAADALVVVTARGDASVATGKLFEYLGAGRPILALADGSEAGRLVRELEAGLVTQPDDPAAAAEAVRRIATGDAPTPDPRGPLVGAFHRRALAGRIARALDAAVTGRTS